MHRLTCYRPPNPYRSRRRGPSIASRVPRGLFFTASACLILAGYIADTYADSRSGKGLVRQGTLALKGASGQFRPQSRSAAGRTVSGGPGTGVTASGTLDVKGVSISTVRRGSPAAKGQTNVSAGGSASIDLTGDGLIRVRVSGEVAGKSQDAVDTNAGRGAIRFRDGTAGYGGNAAADVITGAVNNESIRKADGIGKKGDKVVLMDSGGFNNSTASAVRDSVGGRPDPRDTIRSGDRAGRSSRPEEMSAAPGVPAVADSMTGPPDHAAGARPEESKNRIFIERQGSQLSLRIGSGNNGNLTLILSGAGAGAVIGDGASEDTSANKECAGAVRNPDAGACIGEAVVAQLGLVDFGLFLLPQTYAKPDAAIRPVALGDPEFPVELRPADPEDEQGWQDFYEDVVHAFLRERAANWAAVEQVGHAAHVSLAGELLRVVAYYERVRAREAALLVHEERSPPQMDSEWSGRENDDQESVIEVDASAWWSLLGDPWLGQGN